MDPKEQKEGVNWAELSDEEAHSESGDEKEEQPTENTQKEGETGTRTFRTHRGRGRGKRGGKSGYGDRGDKRSKENQPKDEMISLINKETGLVTVVLFDVDYNSTEEDVKNVYPDVAFISVTQPKKGLYLVELSKENALKLVEAGSKTINGRPFYMKLGYANKKKEDEWHVVNKDRHKADVGHREDKKKYEKPYNRKEHGDNHGGFKKPYRKKEHTGNDSQQAQPDPDDKYFKNRNVDGSEPFKIKFTRGTSNKTGEEEKKEETNKPPKQNPFGEAVPRDEIEFEKKKEEEKKPENVENKTENATEEAPKDAAEGETKEKKPYKKHHEKNGAYGSRPPGISGKKEYNKNSRNDKQSYEKSAPVQSAKEVAEAKEKEANKKRDAVAKHNPFAALDD